MDGMVLGIFLFTTFVGGVVAGLAGFAMSLVVSGVWLHILTPIQTVTLIVGYGVLVQGYGMWKLRHARPDRDLCLACPPPVRARRDYTSRTMG